MSLFKNRLIEELIEREGGHSNDPTDRGGETMFGVTEAVARQFGYQGPMHLLTYETAFAIYEQQYWAPLKLDEVSKYGEDLCEQLFDFCVHSGQRAPGRSLQKTLNVLNKCQQHYPDLVVDGLVGARTMVALKKYVQHRGQAGIKVLAEAIRGQRIDHCIEIAVHDESQEKYSFGWLKRIVNL